MESTHRLFHGLAMRSLRVTCDTRRFRSEAAAVHHQDECDYTKEEIFANNVEQPQYVQLVQNQQCPEHREGEDGPPFRVGAAVWIDEKAVVGHIFYRYEATNWPASAMQ